MRVILDECLPKRLRRLIPGHFVTTVAQAGWSGLSNGALLRRIAGAYDCFITIDKNLPSQQAVGALPFGVIVLLARSNKIVDVTPFAPLF